MGRKSTNPHKSIYQITRERLNLTREKASELMPGISPDRIEKIENGKVNILPGDILEMSKCYKDPSLCNYYCTHECEIGKVNVQEIKQKELHPHADLKTLDPKNFLPFNNRTVTHMITVSSGVFFAVTTSAAAVKAVEKNKGGKGEFVQDFLLSINYVGVGRFVIALGAEAKYVIKDVKKLYHAYRERLDVIGEPVIDFDALDYLALTPEQAKILLSLKRQKVLFDIGNTADEAVKAAKREWLSEWLGLCAQSLDMEQEKCYIDPLEDVFSALHDSAKTANTIDWLYLVSMELALFRPYFTLGDESVKKYKGLKYKADFDKEVFCVEQDIISADVYRSIVKEYKKAISFRQNQTQKLYLRL